MVEQIYKAKRKVAACEEGLALESMDDCAYIDDIIIYTDLLNKAQAELSWLLVRYA